MLVVNDWVASDAMMCRWSVAEDRPIGEKKLDMSLYQDFMQEIPSQILSGRKYKRRTTERVMTAGLRSNLISVLCSKDF